jgi:hypothetical protein
MRIGRVSKPAFREYDTSAQLPDIFNIQKNLNSQIWYMDVCASTVKIIMAFAATPLYP